MDTFHLYTNNIFFFEMYLQIFCKNVMLTQHKFMSITKIHLETQHNKTTDNIFHNLNRKIVWIWPEQQKNKKTPKKLFTIFFWKLFLLLVFATVFFLVWVYTYFSYWTLCICMLRTWSVWNIQKIRLETKSTKPFIFVHFTHDSWKLHFHRQTSVCRLHLFFCIFYTSCSGIVWVWWFVSDRWI